MIGRDFDMIGLSAALAGDVDPALRLLSETQAAVLGVRSGNAGIADALGGAWLEAEVPAQVSDDFGARLLARIDAYENNIRQAKSAAKAAGASIQELLELPQPLRDLAIEGAGGTGWTFAGPGVRSMTINTGGSLPTRLLRIEPGHGAPNHDHTGTEYTLVISGAFDDGTGHFGPGDLSVKRAGQIHHPIAAQGAVCFALAVEEGEVAFTGPLGVLQRLFTSH